MNVEMWKNPIVQKNISFLEGLGRYFFIQPAEGLLACGDVGQGKIAENDTIAGEVRRIIGR
jgi:phosphopantothenoylcysteine decarboxylase/phosphopantothenate--cysteine ligase